MISDYSVIYEYQIERQRKEQSVLNYR